MPIEVFHFRAHVTDPEPISARGSTENGQRYVPPEIRKSYTFAFNNILSHIVFYNTRQLLILLSSPLHCSRDDFTDCIVYAKRGCGEVDEVSPELQ